MSLTGILLGLINICIVVAILILIGYIVVWIFGLIGFAIPDMVQKLYLVIVALVALYMIASLLLGRSTITIIGQHQSAPIGAAMPAHRDIIKNEHVWLYPLARQMRILP